MKRFVSSLLLLLMLSGCSFLPKNVEYFQDKVKKLPAPSESHIEARKEVAAKAAEKAKETFVAAVKENASTNIVTPAIDTWELSDGLSDSLGKPASPVHEYDSAYLVDRLAKMDAKLDQQLHKFEVKNNENAGKAIEGTGLIQMGYFTHLVLVGIIIAVLWFALKIFGMFNPGVGVGTKIIEGGAGAVSRLVSKGFSEMVEGGEEFKKQVSTKIEDPDTKAKVLELFRQSHMTKQSRDVQDVVKKLTT